MGLTQHLPRPCMNATNTTTFPKRNTAAPEFSNVPRLLMPSFPNRTNHLENTLKPVRLCLQGSGRNDPNCQAVVIVPQQRGRERDTGRGRVGWWKVTHQYCMWTFLPSLSLLPPLNFKLNRSVVTPVRQVTHDSEEIMLWVDITSYYSSSVISAVTKCPGRNKREEFASQMMLQNFFVYVSDAESFATTHDVHDGTRTKRPLTCVYYGLTGWFGGSSANLTARKKEKNEKSSHLQLITIWFWAPRILSVVKGFNISQVLKLRWLRKKHNSKFTQNNATSEMQHWTVQFTGTSLTFLLSLLNKEQYKLIQCVIIDNTDGLVEFIDSKNSKLVLSSMLRTEVQGSGQNLNVELSRHRNQMYKR